MSTLIRNRAVAQDDYAVVADDQPLAAGAKAIAPLARVQAEAGVAPQGVRIPNTADVAALWPLLKERALIVLEFPAFPDGRAYSQARTLRDRFGYKGEIRATGAAVVLDQIQLMQRCGIDSFVLRADQKPEACVALLKKDFLAYQPAADGLRPVPALRG